MEDHISFRRYVGMGSKRSKREEGMRDSNFDELLGVSCHTCAKIREFRSDEMQFKEEYPELADKENCVLRLHVCMVHKVRIIEPVPCADYCRRFS